MNVIWSLHKSHNYVKSLSRKILSVFPFFSTAANCLNAPTLKQVAHTQNQWYTLRKPTGLHVPDGTNRHIPEAYMDTSGIGLGLMVSAIGLILLAAPEASIKIAIIMMGLAALLNGIHELLTTRKQAQEPLVQKTIIVNSVAGIVIGIVAVAMPLIFFGAAQAVLRIMIYITAVYLVLSAVAQIFVALKLGLAGIPSGPLLARAGAFIIAAIVMFMIPKNFGIVITRILGLLMLLSGVCIALYAWRNRSYVITPEEVKDAKAPEITE